MKISSYQVENAQKLPYSIEVTWVLLLVCLLAVQYFLTMYLVTMRARMRALTDDFMKQFAKEHAEAFGGQKQTQFGYPDSGNGRYAKKLPYLDWYDMNNGQRAQINFLEQITFIVGLSLITAANTDYLFGATAILTAYSCGRALFTLGYIQGGPNGRIVGAIIMDLAILALLWQAFAAVYGL